MINQRIRFKGQLDNVKITVDELRLSFRKVFNAPKARNLLRKLAKAYRIKPKFDVVLGPKIILRYALEELNLYVQAVDSSKKRVWRTLALKAFEDYRKKIIYL